MKQYKIEKEFNYKGYKCVVIAQFLGHRCGYIGIDKNDKCYEKDYDELQQIEVHGGLTYSQPTDEREYPTKDKLWWIGYDCGHCGDGKDINIIKELGGQEYYEYELKMRETFKFIEDKSKVRSLDYCINQCKSVVNQIIDINKNN